MASELTLTAVFETVENGWVQARVRELPEVITTAPDRDQAQELLLDAVLEYLSSLSQPLTGAPDGESQPIQLTVSA